MSEPQEKLRLLRSHYRSGKHNLAREFFGPCMSSFSRYRRAAGFFSSSVLRTWAECLPRVAADQDVRIQLLVSPEISEADKQAFGRAVDDAEKQHILDSSVEHFVKDVFDFQNTRTRSEQETLRGKLLAWLIVHGRLELRFAVNIHRNQEFGIFHTKIGVFDYPWSDCVAFTGSANESNTAHAINSESVDVYRSWVQSERERIETKIEEFDEAWNANSPNLKVIPLSAKALEYVTTAAPEELPNIEPRAPEPEEPADPLATLWPHQKEAVEAFMAAGHGILEMATGTGKTRTALAIAGLLKSEGNIESLIVTMEGVDLLKQWHADLCSWGAEHGFKRVLRHFESNHENQDYLLMPSGSILLCSRSALRPVLRDLQRSQRVPTLIVHDEVHGLGSPESRSNLQGQPQLFPYRLGLSATPERFYDADGTNFITTEIGPIVFKFGLEEAIRAGILCPFDYLWIPYRLTNEDKQDLRNVRAREAAARAQGNPWIPEKLMIEISRVYKKAREKLPNFARWLKKRAKDFLKSSIIFVEDIQYADNLYSTVHEQTHRYSCYYATDSPEILERFAQGELDCLITCHKISQGIDIRTLEKIVLFSSSKSPLETIQRLGRCLRTDPDRPQKIATVVDFVLVDDNGNPDPDGIDYDRFSWFQVLSQVRPDHP
jgi:superfamily II DNA or RNA helicase